MAPALIQLFSASKNKHSDILYFSVGQIVPEIDENLLLLEMRYTFIA